MAEGAFALSPLSASARAVAPSDADYEAIREAFLETARGRWFLSEYTRRNRNADTAMVLEAVARIEQSMAAARAETVVSPNPPSSDRVLAALQKVKASIETILAEPLFEDSLLRWRRSSRIIHEIAWALRESGSDPRICDILDGQVRNIEETCDGLSLGDLPTKILGVFDTALREASPEPETEARTTAGAETAAVTTNEVVDEAPVESPQANVLPSDAAEMPALETAGIAAVGATGVEQSATEPVAIGSALTDTAVVDETHVHLETAQPPFAPPDSIAQPESAAADMPVPTHAPAFDTPAPAPSLGESVIAQGLVKRPLSSRSDPLAPIRRMSQAEKIAFFS